MVELQAMSRMVANEAHRRLVSDCNGHGKRRALAGGGYRQVAGVGEALGSSLHMGQALRRVREPRPVWEVIPAQGPDSSKGGKIRAPCMI